MKDKKREKSKSALSVVRLRPPLKAHAVSAARVKAITMKLRSNRNVKPSTLRWASSEKVSFSLTPQGN